MKVDLLNHTIFGKYKVNKVIGKGSFGSIFQGKNIKNNELVAIKTELAKNPGSLESEAYFLFYLKNFGIPEIKSFGIHKKYKILVETLLGKDLLKLFENQKKINEKDIYMIFIQLIERLEYIHSKYIIHRDLKPENIMFDLEAKKFIYLIDFGLAKKYRSGKTKKHIKYNVCGYLYGSYRYCSLNTMSGIEQSRRDDLESAGYVMIYLSKKFFLPWIATKIKSAKEKYYYIIKLKKETSIEKLCENLPKAFCDYMKYVRKLKFEEDPNYNYLKGLFLDLLTSLEMKNDLRFSWISKKEKELTEINLKKESNFYKRKTSFQIRLLKKIESNEKEKINYNSENIGNKIISLFNKDNKEEQKIQTKKLNMHIIDEKNISQDDKNDKNYKIYGITNNNSNNFVINTETKNKNKNLLINKSKNNDNNLISLRKISPFSYMKIKQINSRNNKYIIINKKNKLKDNNNNKNNKAHNKDNNNNFINRNNNNLFKSAKSFPRFGILSTIPLTRKNINYNRKTVSKEINKSSENYFITEKNNKVYKNFNQVKIRLFKNIDYNNNVLKMNFNTINVGVFNQNNNSNSFQYVNNINNYFQIINNPENIISQSNSTINQKKKIFKINLKISKNLTLTDDNKN